MLNVNVTGHIQADLSVSWAIYNVTDTSKIVLGTYDTAEEAQAFLRGILIGRGEDADQASIRAYEAITQALHSVERKQLEMEIKDRRNGWHGVN